MHYFDWAISIPVLNYQRVTINHGDLASSFVRKKGEIDCELSTIWVLWHFMGISPSTTQSSWDVIRISPLVTGHQTGLVGKCPNYMEVSSGIYSRNGEVSIVTFDYQRVQGEALK